MADRASIGRALLTALAGITAYEAGVPTAELAAMGEEAPGESFAAAVALASTLADEVRRLGGDPAAIRRRVYGKADELAYLP